MRLGAGEESAGRSEPGGSARAAARGRGDAAAGAGAAGAGQRAAAADPVDTASEAGGARDREAGAQARAGPGGAAARGGPRGDDRAAAAYPGTADGAGAARQVRDILDRAKKTLGSVNYQRLTTARRDEYDRANLMIKEAEEAVKAEKFDYAKNLADKADQIAKELLGG